MTELRRVEVRLEDVLDLTYLELARVLVRAELREADWIPLLRRLNRKEASPQDLERGVTFLYAAALALQQRDDPALAWADAERWRVVLVGGETRDVEADAVARAGAQASILTGLPPREAGALTVRELEAYGQVKTELLGAATKRRAG